MRNCVLNISIAIIALSSLPSCTTDPADEVNDVVDVGVPPSDVESTERSSSNEDVRNDAIEASTDVATATAQVCSQYGWGSVCSWTNDLFQFVGAFRNDEGGANTVYMRIFNSSWQVVAQGGWAYVPYGHVFKVKHSYPTYGAWYISCVYLANGRSGCSPWTMAL